MIAPYEKTSRTTRYHSRIVLYIARAGAARTHGVGGRGCCSRWVGLGLVATNYADACFGVCWYTPACWLLANRMGYAAGHALADEKYGGQAAVA